MTRKKVYVVICSRCGELAETSIVAGGPNLDDLAGWDVSAGVNWLICPKDQPKKGAKK